MSGYSYIINSVFTDSKSFLRSYLAFKKDRDQIKKIAFSFEEIPFSGNFAILAGVDEIITFLTNFKFSDEDIQFLKQKFGNLDHGYFEYLKNINVEEFHLYGFENGSEFFANEKILILKGKLPVILLLTYAISNIISFSTLVCTNSMRMRKIAGEDISMLEFGLRRAQGPMAGNFASKYAYLGGFSAISNCLAGMYYELPVKGTCAHAYIMSFQNQLNEDAFLLDDDPKKNIYSKALEYRNELNWSTNLDELKAFCSFARIYKDSSLLLVDTYNTIHSGVKNTILVSLALNHFCTGLNVRGVRLDSGDLADLSKKAKLIIDEISEKYGNMEMKKLKIGASNDINENSLKLFNKQGHDLHILGIGTNLVTCQLQPFCYIKSEIKDAHYNHLICNFLNKENKVIQKRAVYERVDNCQNEIDFEEHCLKLLHNDENSTDLIVEKKIVNLYKDGVSYNTKSLLMSKAQATENYFKIYHIIQLEQKDLPTTNFDYIERKV